MANRIKVWPCRYVDGLGRRGGCYTRVRNRDGSSRAVQYPPLINRIRMHRDDAKFMRQWRFLPGTKVPKVQQGYWERLVSIPLIMAEVEGRVWRSRQPRLVYPPRPKRRLRRGL